jgi:hypothetical protein
MSFWKRLLGLEPSDPPRAAQTQAASLSMIAWRDGSFPMQVVGESYCQDALIAICGRHTRYGYEGEHVASLRRDTRNTHDPDAVEVVIDGRRVGYLEREQARRVSSQLNDANLSAVRCKARIRGGWRTNQHDEGHYGVALSVPNMGWIDFGIGASPPPPEPRKPPVRRPMPTPAEHGPLSGERIHLWGEHPPGVVASELASLGAKLMSGIGKSTTMLVIVESEPWSFGLRRSATMVKARDLAEGGQKIRILSLAALRAELSVEPRGSSHE